MTQLRIKLWKVENFPMNHCRTHACVYPLFEMSFCFWLLLFLLFCVLYTQSQIFGGAYTWGRKNKIKLSKCHKFSSPRELYIFILPLPQRVTSAHIHIHLTIIYARHVRDMKFRQKFIKIFERISVIFFYIKKYKNLTVENF